MDEKIIAMLSLCCSFREVCSFRLFSDFSDSRLVIYVGQCPKHNKRKIYPTRLYSVVRSAIILSAVIFFKVCRFPYVQTVLISTPTSCFKCVCQYTAINLDPANIYTVCAAAVRYLQFLFQYSPRICKFLVGICLFDAAILCERRDKALSHRGVENGCHNIYCIKHSSQIGRAGASPFTNIQMLGSVLISLQFSYYQETNM